MFHIKLLSLCFFGHTWGFYLAILSWLVNCETYLGRSQKILYPLIFFPYILAALCSMQEPVI